MRGTIRKNENATYLSFEFTFFSNGIRYGLFSNDWKEVDKKRTDVIVEFLKEDEDEGFLILFFFVITRQEDDKL